MTVYLGALVGLFSVCTFAIHNYINLNIGLTLTIYQSIAYFIQWVIVGAAIGLIYQIICGGVPEINPVVGFGRISNRCATTAFVRPMIWGTATIKFHVGALRQRNGSSRSTRQRTRQSRTRNITARRSRERLIPG